MGYNIEKLGFLHDKYAIKFIKGQRTYPQIVIGIGEKMENNVF